LPQAFLRKDRFIVRGLKGKDLNHCGASAPNRQNVVQANKSATFLAEGGNLPAEKTINVTVETRYSDIPHHTVTF
jgi:hypothetical protein